MSGRMHARNATVTVSLKADSGYSSSETHRVSPDQWGRICAILNEPEAAKSQEATA